MRSISLGILMLASLTAPTSTALASLLGDTVYLEWQNYATDGSGLVGTTDWGAAVVGPGFEYPEVDVDAFSVTIAEGGIYPPAEFDRYTLSGIESNTGGVIVGIDILENTVGLTTDQVTFAKNLVSVVLNGTDWSQPTRALTIGLSFGPLECPGIGAEPPSTPTLRTNQNNACENWTGTTQTADDLSNAILWSADLSLSNFALTDFQGSDLNGSHIGSSNLTFASLVGADLDDASLSGTLLPGADLSGASVSNLDLSGAYYDSNTLFPSGNTYDAPPWGLDGGISPWDAGMIPVPEASMNLMVLIGAGALRLAAIERGA